MADTLETSAFISLSFNMSLLDSGHTTHAIISTALNQDDYSRHRGEAEEQWIDILHPLHSHSIIPSIPRRISIGSIKYRREYNREKGEYKKVNSEEIEMIPRIV